MPRLNCPRCGLTLTRQKYENVDVDICGECWGVWLDKGELEQIVASKQYRFSPEERNALKNLLVAGKPSPEGGKTAGCPSCGKTMERSRYSRSTSIWMDSCAEHGVWLDNREIKAIQVFHEERGDELGNHSLLGALGHAGD